MARTLKRWRSQILAWHSTGASNGQTEGLNSIIKKVEAGRCQLPRLLAVGGCDWSLLGLAPTETRRTDLEAVVPSYPSTYSCATSCPLRDST